MPTFKSTSDEKQFDLKTATRNSQLRISTGPETDRWLYEFNVLEPVSKTRRYPHGVLIAVTPDGSRSDDLEISIVGCGGLTTRRENPVQVQERAFSIGFDYIRVGSFLVAIASGHSGFLTFDKPGQEIAAIDYED